MVMATDALIRKATNTYASGQFSQLVNQLWASELQTNLRRRAVLEQSLLVNTDLMVPNSGDRVFIPALPDIAMADALTDGTDMALYTMSNAAYIPLIPTEYGKTVEITRKALDRIKYDAMAAIMDRLAYSMSIRIENNIGALYNATASAAFPNSKSLFGGGAVTTIPTIYPNGHATGTIVSTDTMSASVLSQAVAQMQQFDNVPFDDGFYYLFMAPDAYQSMIMDQNIRQDLRYAAPQRLLNGEVGALDGVRIILTNYVVTANEGAGAAVPVNNNLLVAPRWASIAYKRKPELTIDPTLYDMGRRRRFGVFADFDIQLVHPERAIVIKTAKQF